MQAEKVGYVTSTRHPDIAENDGSTVMTEQNNRPLYLLQFWTEDDGRRPLLSGWKTIFR
jgi:hypothetical protein